MRKFHLCVLTALACFLLSLSALADAEVSVESVVPYETTPYKNLLNMEMRFTFTLRNTGDTAVELQSVHYVLTSPDGTSTTSNNTDVVFPKIIQPGERAFGYVLLIPDHPGQYADYDIAFTPVFSVTEKKLEDVYTLIRPSWCSFGAMSESSPVLFLDFYDPSIQPGITIWYIAGYTSQNPTHANRRNYGPIESARYMLYLPYEQLPVLEPFESYAIAVPEELDFWYKGRDINADIMYIERMNH